MKKQLSFTHLRWAKAEQRYREAARRHRGQREAWRKLHKWATAALRVELK